MKAVIFDLDGVLTDTARLHYLAWQRLADELKIPFDEKLNESMKGVDRMNSLKILLGKSAGAFSAAEKQAMAETKNGYYRRLIETLGPQDLLPGAEVALRSVKKAGFATALASASKNAPAVLSRLGIASWFDFLADANLVRRHKPHPEIFFLAAAGLRMPAAACLGIEDAAAGIAAIKAAGMPAVGIGDPGRLAAADLVFDSIAAFRIADCVRLFNSPER